MEAGIATSKPTMVDSKASAIPGATTVILAEPCCPISKKAFIMKASVFSVSRNKPCGKIGPWSGARPEDHGPEGGFWPSSGPWSKVGMESNIRIFEYSNIFEYQNTQIFDIRQSKNCRIFDRIFEYLHRIFEYHKLYMKNQILIYKHNFLYFFSKLES